jgi:hypothetical protein
MFTRSIFAEKENMRRFRRKKMRYAPRYVIYWAVLKYLKKEQVACLHFELEHTEIQHNQQFILLLERYFDWDIFIKNPLIEHDVGLYYYLMWDPACSLEEKGYIRVYEKEVMGLQQIAFEKLFESYLLVGIC